MFIQSKLIHAKYYYTANFNGQYLNDRDEVIVGLVEEEKEIVQTYW